jgi:hypothetical protein
MSAVCLAALGLVVHLPFQAFTLEWTHSIEKIRWEEDYRVVAGGLQLTEARIRGSGAGMEPLRGAVLKEGVWHYTPSLPVQKRLRLARSAYAGDYTLCWSGACHPLAEFAGPVEKSEVVELFVCNV